jgi:cytidylate kinase
MYRAITYLALKDNIIDDKEKILEKLKDFKIDLKVKDGYTHVILNEQNISEEIRSVEVNNYVSDVSAIPEVRDALLKLQRSMSAENNIIAEGRDTGTAVFPDADVKIYFTATVEKRAERRFNEYLSKNHNVSFEEVKQNIIKRDQIDSNRTVSPLRKADDALEIDTTNMTIEEEIEFVMKKLNELDVFKDLERTY